MRRNSASRSKSASPLNDWPALLWGAGLFVFLLLPAAPVSAESTAQREPFIQFAPVRWLENLDRLAPDYEAMEELQIPEFPPADADRIGVEPAAEKAVAPPDHPFDGATFQSRFLTPLEAFLLPQTVRPDEEEDPAAILSLQQALMFAFASNPSVQVRDLQEAVEAERLTQAEALFVPTLELSSEFGQSRFPQNAAEASANNLFPIGDQPRFFQSKTGVIEAALRGEAAVGTQYELYSNIRYNQTTLTRTSPSALFREEYSSNVGVRVTQPLLQGASRQIRETPIRIARINQRIASADLRFDLNQLAGNTLEAYLRWVEAAELLELRRWERRTYAELAEIVARRVETGGALSRELLRVEIRLTRIEDQVLQAREQFEQARSLILAEFGSRFPAEEYHNTRPSGELSPEVPDVVIESTVAYAVQSSSKIQRLRYEVDVQRENLHVALDETRPSLDLVGGVEMRGLNSGPASTFDHMASNQPTGYNVGIVYSRPWGNERAEAQVREGRHTLRQSEIELMRAEHELRHRIATEIERLGTLRERRDNIARLLTDIAAEIEEENRRLETGQTTLSALLEFYDDLFQVRAQYLTILRQINEAKVRLWTADESILDRLGIEYISVAGR